VFTTVKVCASPSTFQGFSVAVLHEFTDQGESHLQGLECTLGIIHIARGKASTSLTEPLFANSSTTLYALAFYSGLWAFDGWDQANYVGGEMKNSQKTLPRVIHFSMVLVMVRMS
jgi:amino acid transporter